MSAPAPTDIQTSFHLQAFNTLSIPARAEYFIAASAIEQIRQAIAWATANGLRITVLGGGSNVVLPEVIDGLVIQPNITGITPHPHHNDVISVGAGENWHLLVAWCVDNKLFGLENLALIPGLVGGAPIQNIGAYGVEIKDVFHSLEAIRISTGELLTFTSDDCAFGYRDSVFKNSGRDQYIIVSVSLQLSREEKINIDYPELQNYFSGKNRDSITPAQVFNAVVAVRRAKLPDPAELPNAGSFFKNPVVDLERYSVIKKDYPDVVAYPHSPAKMKLAAGWLIDRLGWKGRERHGVFVHRNQALVLTNPNRMPAERILKLASEIQADVLNRFGIELEIEPRVF